MRGTKEFFKDVEGGWRWRIKAGNNRITADSGEGYQNLKDAKRGMFVTLLVLLFGKSKMLK